jgi:hypothetical protein
VERERQRERGRGREGGERKKMSLVLSSIVLSISFWWNARSFLALLQHARCNAGAN